LAEQFQIMPTGAFGAENSRSENLSLSSQSISQSIGYHGGGLTSISTTLTVPLTSLFASQSFSGNIGYGEFWMSFGTQGGAIGGLTLESLELNGGSIASAIPEPSTWAMVLVGFAGIGFITYRRSRTIQPLLFSIRLQSPPQS
jgi:hypothetical protein